MITRLRPGTDERVEFERAYVTNRADGPDTCHAALAGVERTLCGREPIL